MVNYNEQIVLLWQEWEAGTGQNSGDPNNFVEWAVANKKLAPYPQDVKKMLRRQVTQSLRQARRREGALEIPCHFCKLKKRNDTCEKNLILM